MLRNTLPTDDKDYFLEQIRGIEIDEEEYHRVLEAETFKGTPHQQATNIAWRAARLKYKEKQPLLKWEGFEELFRWSPEQEKKLTREITELPYVPEYYLSYIRRPAEAVKAGIKAKIEKKEVLPAIKGGLTGEEETKGRDILDALGIPLDDPDWILNHPVQHFLVEMGGAGLEFVTDPIIWALWFAPGTKLLKGAQKYLARKEITKFAKTLKADLSGVAAPGAKKVLLEELKETPRYGKYLTKPWFREIAKHFKGTEYAPVFSVPAKMTPQSLELLPKFAPLAAKAGGIIPKIDTSEYIRYWDTLSPSEQKLELERKKALKAPRKTLFPEAEMPRTKQMAMYTQELERLRKAGMTGKVAEKEAMMRAAEKFKKLEEKKPVAEQLKWELGAPTIKGQREIEFAAPEVAPKVETAAEESARHAKMTTKEVMAELGERDDIQAEAQLEAEAMAAGVPKAEVPYPTAKEVVKELSTKIRTKQNTDIEEAVFTTGIPPDSLKQGLYVYNHTGKSITEPDKRIKAFEKLLEKNNPVAYKALSTGMPQISIEEVSLKMTTLDKEVARLNKGADTEFESVRDFIYKEAFLEEVKPLLDRVKEHGGIKYTSAMKDYPEEWKQIPVSVKRKTGLPLDEMADELGMDIEDLVEQLAQHKARPKPSDFDVEAYEAIERNLDDFPNYMKRMELLEQRDRYQSALLELRTKTPPPEPSAVVDQREVKIEPEPKLEEEKIKRLEEKPEEEKPIADVMSMEMERIRAIEQMKLKFGDVVTDKGATPPRDVGSGLEPPIKGEQLFLDIIPPDEIPVDIEPWPTSNKDVGALGWVRRVDYLFSDYQRATGVPIYSEGYKPIADASKMMRLEEITLRGTLAQILRGFPKDRRIAIGKAMEGKEIELSDREKVALEGMRNFFRFLGKEFGIPEEQMIEDYLPRIMIAFRGGDPGLMPAEMEAWFKKHRIGELRWKKEDPLEITRIYIHAGLRDKYLYESRLIPDFVKHIQNLSFGIKSKASFWLTHKILRHPTRFDAEIAGSMENIPGVEKALNKWGVDSTVAVRQITRGISQCLYAGGIGFRVISAGKNVTQQTHNIAILGPKYWIRGLINCPKEEEREVIESLNILRKYGAELERRGIDNPASVPQQVADAGNFLFRKVDSLNRRVCLTGTREMVFDAQKLLDKGKIDKQQFLKKTKFDLLPFGRRPEAIELFNKGDIEGYANVLGEEFVKLGQYTYEAEDMPLLFSGSTGRLASVFMSWPIEYIEMQAHFIKTGHWESVLYYYLAAMAVQNGLRYAGVETNPYGYGDVKIGNHRISLVPGGWFLLGSIPTSFSPAIQILYSGGRVAAVYLKGGSDRYLNTVKQEFLRSTTVLAPFKIAGSDIIQAIEEIQSGKYGKRDKNGRLIYISDETEVILRGLGFTTVTEARETGRYREPIYEFGEEERKLGKPTPLRRKAPSWWETH